MAAKNTAAKSNVVKHSSADSAKAMLGAKSKIKKETAAKSKAKVQAPTEILMKRNDEKETKGAYVFAAVNDKGKSLEYTATMIHSVYLRKSHTEGKPAFIKITVEALKALPKAQVADEDD